jgi:hypothetical protein
MRRPTVVLLRILAAAAAVLVGYGHFYLWDKGYKHTPVGSLFLVDFGAGIVIGALLVVGPRRLGAFLGAGLAVLTFAGFVLSRGPGVPTFNGTFQEKGFFAPTTGLHFLGANIALSMLVIEAICFVLCVALFFMHPASGAAVAAVPGGAPDAGVRRPARS